MIQHAFYEGGFWFRIFGYGLSVRNRDKFPATFSVRNGYVKELRVGKYGIKILNRTESRFSIGRSEMPNPFDAVMFVLLVISALQGMGWLPW